MVLYLPLPAERRSSGGSSWRRSGGSGRSRSSGLGAAAAAAAGRMWLLLRPWLYPVFSLVHCITPSAPAHFSGAGCALPLPLLLQGGGNSPED